MAFSLTKWYVDVVTDDGRAAIAYWADVRWGPLHQGLCGLLLHGVEAGPAPWRFSGHAVAPPSSGATGLHWTADPLELFLQCLRLETGFHHRLLDGPDGAIDWYCVLPRAHVRLEAGARVLEGIGYAERLEMTCLPWRIPADEIRWGRCLADAPSIVWIEWHGTHPQRLVFHGGELTSAGLVSDERVRFGDGSELVLDDSRVVSDDVLGGLLGPLEALRPLIAPVARTRQTRWLSRGTLHDSGAAPRAGWAIHEWVRRR
jgi:hypothetical protein